MARTRSIKPEVWTDEKLAKLSRDTRLFFIGMWSFADDQGTTHANPHLLKSQVFPYDEDLTIEIVMDWLDDLTYKGMLIPYEAENGENYYYIRQFLKHQKIDHPAKTQYNPIPREGLASLSRVAREDCRKTVRQTETEYKLKQKQKQKGKVNRLLSDLQPDDPFDPINNSEDDNPKKSWNKDVQDLCKLLHDLIIKDDPKFNRLITDTWLGDMEKIIRIDLRTVLEIEAIIKWANADSFWKSNILSPGKLRQQFTRLILDRDNKGRRVKAPTRHDQNQEAIERVIKKAEAEHGGTQNSGAGFEVPELGPTRQGNN